ncbi:MAG: hypothetical protein QM767_24105 [Anaeromyxobacter sp.]
MTRRTKLLLAASGAILLVAGSVAGVALLKARHTRSGGADAKPPIALQAGDAAPELSIYADVYAPEAVWKASLRSEWTKRALAEPLGKGFGGDWGAFLGTRGTDLSGAFEGTVADLVASRLLANPFRVVLYGGPGATGSPAVIVPDPSSSARGAFELMEGATRSGRFEAARCPGADKDLAEKIVVSRWLVADHAVFAAQRDGQLYLAKNPIPVVQAICLPPPAVERGDGVDLAVSIAREGLGREAQLGFALLGLGPAPRLLFGVEGERLVPRGLGGELEDPQRLAAAAPSDKLLKLLPGDAGLVVLATLDLPEPLDRASLKAHLARKYSGKRAPRTVALVWNPRGADALDTEVALAWPERDAAALQDAFTGGGNVLATTRACGHVVLASTPALAATLQRSCNGKAPSMLDAAPAVAEGLRQPVSLGLGVNPGRALSRLLGDAWTSERGKKVAPEIEAARRLLEELPYVGLRGVAKDRQLVPGGFRS